MPLKSPKQLQFAKLGVKSNIGIGPSPNLAKEFIASTTKKKMVGLGKKPVIGMPKMGSPKLSLPYRRNGL